jgi:ubiquinone biosynthesis protein
LIKQHRMIGIGFDISSLVPEAYAAYRPAILEALAFFVNRLPDQRRMEILSEQSAMEPDVPLADRLLALLHRCPTLHKLGQVVSRNRHLDVELRARLCTLETMAPRVPVDVVRSALDLELPGLERQGVSVEATALAEASVAVVIPFTWKNDSGDPSVRGVFKILKPGIEQTLNEELAIWSELGGILDKAVQRLGIPPLAYQETFDRVRELLIEEIQLEHEQRNLQSAKEAFAALEYIRIPSLLPFCTGRVTAMEFMEGDKLADVAQRPDTARRRSASLLAGAMLAHPLFNPSEEALFHADPHAGNLILDPDGRLAIIDWSLVGRLTREQRAHVVHIVLGAWTLDAVRITRALSSLAVGMVDANRLRVVADRALQRVRRGVRPGFCWLVSLLDEAAIAGGVRFDRHLLMFRKTLLTLEGVIDDLCPGFDVDTELYSAGLMAFGRDWPRRMTSPAGSNGFSTHLSNADLTELWWSAATTGWRAWVGAWSDAIRKA